MARGVNKVILVGNLGQDPDVKYTQGGMAICTLSIATTSVRKDREGNQTERTEWHRVKLLGKLGEIAGEYLKKGRQVYIEGSLRYNTSGEGDAKRYYTDIVADEMQMLGGQGGGSSGERPARREPPTAREQYGGGRGGGKSRNEAPAARNADFGDDFADDDIPF
ncbi:MAG TPA: single-stranded DNA-binding protein [Lysobacter sp.]|nr:single-stranded DNA-binding protein [Lysobacter sp.]